MGWGNCGTDSQGRSIGYCHEGICDHKGCKTKIDRGLAYACGGMHGDINSARGEEACEKYFCNKHLTVVEDKEGNCFSVCQDCLEKYKDSWVDD